MVSASITDREEIVAFYNVPFEVPSGVLIVGKCTLSANAKYNWSDFPGTSVTHNNSVHIQLNSVQREILSEMFTTTAKSGSKSRTGNPIAITNETFGDFEPGSELVLEYYYSFPAGSVAGMLVAHEVRYDVAEWAEPQILYYTAYRVDASTGLPSVAGTKIKYSLSANTTPLTGYGAAAFKVRYRKTAESTWTEINLTPVDNAIGVAAVQIDDDFPLDESYVFQFIAADGYVSAIAQTEIYTGTITMHYNEAGDGVAFGKYSEGPGFDCDMDADFRKSARFRGTLTFDEAPDYADPAAARAALGIQTGIVSTTLPNNSKKSGSVTFDHAYAAAPIVMLTLQYNDSANTTTVIKLFLVSATTTGFTWSLQSSGSATNAAQVWWVAIGDPA